MTAISVLESLFQFNQWAHRRLFALSASLSEAQLDDSHEIGFGSLRNTLFHNLAAEEVWYERWTGAPWRPFPLSAEGMPLVEMESRFDVVMKNRQTLIEQGRGSDWQSQHPYKDARGNAYSNRLKDLLLHVANHGIHHRAQALQYLKRFGITIPGGLDYLFYKMANPSVRQSTEAIESLKRFGMEVEVGTSQPVAWDGAIMQRYFDYGDWANGKLFPLIQLLEAEQLDRDFGMGLGTIRRIWLHLYDAEAWWWNNWTQGPSAMEKLPNTTSFHELQQRWAELQAKRRPFIEAISEATCRRVVRGNAGGPELQFPLVESMIQLCGHGTHHRAQLVNMLRHSELKPPAIDYVVMLREMGD